MKEEEKEKIVKDAVKEYNDFIDNVGEIGELDLEEIIENAINKAIFIALTDKVASIVEELPLFNAGGVLETGESEEWIDGYNKALQEVRFIPSLKLPASREENG